MPATADTEYLAAFDVASEAFLDLVRSDAAGLSFRRDGSWEAWPPGDMSLDGAEVIDVGEEFTAVVDRAQAARGAVTRADARGHAATDGPAEGAA